MKRIAGIAILLLFAMTLSAGALKKYRSWGDSPQGYFMTKAERDQWAAIKSDDEAKQFIDQFLASRGEGFAQEVQKRATVADQHLSFGKKLGSETLRGKIIILLGPPAAFNVSDREARAAANSNSSVAIGAATSERGGGMNAGDVARSVAAGDMSTKVVRSYAFEYGAGSLPAGWGKPLKLVVELDSARGERVTDRDTAADLDKLFEMAAAASVKTK